MKLRFIAILSTTLLVSSLSIVLISNPAQSARPVPKVTTSYSFSFSPQPHRLQWTEREPFDCYDPECEVTVTDPYGPPLKTAGITFVNRVSNLPTGWSVCTDPDAFNSLDAYLSRGLVTLPSNEWNTLGFNVYGGERPVSFENATQESMAFEYDANSSKRLKYQGFVLICGPDSSTPSGTVWKVVLGPVITLPAANKWR
jgi:hypothetical protein